MCLQKSLLVSIPINELGPYFQVRTFLSISMPVQKPLCPIMHVLHDQQYKDIATWGPNVYKIRKFGAKKYLEKKNGMGHVSVASTIDNLGKILPTTQEGPSVTLSLRATTFWVTILAQITCHNCTEIFSPHGIWFCENATGSSGLGSESKVQGLIDRVF